MGHGLFCFEMSGIHFSGVGVYCSQGWPSCYDSLYWNGQLVWTPALSTLFVGVCIQRELSPTSGYTGISARRRYAMFFYLQSVPTRSLSTLVG